MNSATERLGISSAAGKDAGKETAKLMTEEGLDAFMSFDQDWKETWMREVKEFMSMMMDAGGPQFLCKIATKNYATKFSAPDFGDSAEVVAKKARARTRKLAVELTYSDYRDFIYRVKERSQGRTALKATFFDEADMKSLAAKTDPQTRLVFRRFFDDPSIDPGAVFVVRFADPAISPLASALITGALLH